MMCLTAAAVRLRVCAEASLSTPGHQQLQRRPKITPAAGVLLCSTGKHRVRRSDSEPFSKTLPLSDPVTSINTVVIEVFLMYTYIEYYISVGYTRIIEWIVYAYIQY